MLRAASRRGLVHRHWWLLASRLCRPASTVTTGMRGVPPNLNFSSCSTLSSSTTDASSSSTTATTATTATRSSRMVVAVAWQQRLDALEQSSRHFLVRQGRRSQHPQLQQQQQQQQQQLQAVLVDLMEEWNDLLQEFHLEQHVQQAVIQSLDSNANEAVNANANVNVNRLVQAATERLLDVYNAWNQSSQSTTTTNNNNNSNRPYQILLHAFTSHPATKSGSRAWQILQDWDATLAGDLAQAPTDADAERVLEAYATQSPPPSDTLLQQTTEAPPAEPAISARVAQQLVYQRLEPSYSWSPNPKTYQRLVRCLARAVWEGNQPNRHHQHHSTNEEEKEEDGKLLTALEQAMDKLLQTLPIGHVDSHSMNDNDTYTLALALGDAIQCWEHDSRRSATTTPIFTARRREWLTLWSQVLAPEHQDLLWQRQSSSGWVEHATRSVLQLYHRALLFETTKTTHSNNHPPAAEVLLPYVEPMTHIVLQLDEYWHNSSNNHSSTHGDDDDHRHPNVPDQRQRRWNPAHYYHIVLQAWGHVRKTVVAEESYRAVAQQQQEFLLERLLQQYEQDFHKNNISDEATIAWNGLLRACLDAGCPDRVKTLWDTNQRERTVRKNQESFTILLQSLAAKRPPSSATSSSDNHHPRAAMKRAEEAHAILCRLVQFDRARRRYHPTATMFASVMVAWSRSYHAEAARYCQEVMEMMWQEHEQTNDDDSLIPGAVHYNALVTTWGFSRLPGSFQRVLQVYEEMKQASCHLDWNSYTAVLFALARGRSVESARHAEAVLTELEQDHRWRPTVTNYNSVIVAWGLSGDPNAWQYSQNVYQRLLAAYDNFERDPQLRPDSTTYCGLIDALVSQRHNNSGNNSSNNSNISVVDRAEAILAEMEDRVSRGLAALPDAKVYTSVLKAHWKSDHPDAYAKAAAVVERMKQSYDAGNLKAKPDLHAMTVLLQTLAKSTDPNKASTAWDILNGMRTAFEHGDFDMRPNSYTYAAVLNACAFTRTKDTEIKKRAVKIALLVLNDLTHNTSTSEDQDKGGYSSSNSILDEFLFRDLFRTIVDQVDDLPERTEYASVIFQRCCQEGLVNRRVLSALKEHVPALYKRLPSGPNGELQIPPQWTRRISSSSSSTT